MHSFFSLLTVVTFIVATSGCESGPSGGTPSVPGVDIPFTSEGTLAFSRSDGSPIVEIEIEIADDDSTRTRGLMQRLTLPDKGGMLFVFGDEAVRTFWMANTPLSLDLIFVARSGEVIDIVKYTKPLSPINVTSRSEALYVVEVKAGFSDTWGISETDRIEWSYE